MSVFYDNFIKLCSEKGVAPSTAGQAAGVSSASVSGWKKGAVPRDTVIKNLAEYFGCDVQALTGEQQKKTATSGDGLEEIQALYRTREELKVVIDRLTLEEAEHFLSEMRRTILGG